MSLTDHPFTKAYLMNIGDTQNEASFREALFSALHDTRGKCSLISNLLVDQVEDGTRKEKGRE